MSESVDHPSHYGGDTPYEVKVCSSCDLTQVLDEFPPDKRRKDGRGTKCRVCTIKIREKFYNQYPEKEMTRRLKNAQHGQAWYQRNRASQLERMYWNALKRKYGITRKAYYLLLAEQEGRCAICRTTDPGRGNGNFAVEHDHITKVVRGLTCHSCNVGLGMFKDDYVLLRAAADYLERVVKNV